ncbi:DUF4279 domain-containing protein [Enterococcus sp. BWB1-3]|uniref:DUF4279 domain-containing protein n=1 Tax=Enterococcus sp. BWB1-3 TaxID=2787713 RepID=UPI00192073DD|nr:DUF4279 domain-containing protein [Enterococcus sp. BWB1-3]MBL1229828.1 DUF4279 domain-containing protein [Enterococcus sp. BWB1-3]
MNTGYCSFIVKGHGINFKEIEQKLKTEATKIFKEGQITSEVIGKNEFDLIRFDKEFINESNPNEVLKGLLEQLLPLNSYIEEINNESDVYIKCFLQSNSAQINFRISPEVMNKIAILGIDFEVSILSWGGSK